MSEIEYEARVTRLVDDLVVENDRLWEALVAARRAIGEHNAPGDCYATGPDTGDPYQDLVECPACSAIPLIDDILTAPRRIPRIRERNES